MFYHPSTQTYIREGVAFTLNELQYPANWLNLSTPDEKLILGLVEVVTVGTRADERTHYVSEELVGAERRIVNTPKPAGQQLAVFEAEYTAKLEAFYDAKARERRYDNRYTCALRAGYAGPFQAEGQAFAQWMDACNAIGYTLMAEVAAGTRPLPDFDGVLAAMPALVWPA